MTPYDFGYAALKERLKCMYDDNSVEQADWCLGWFDAANDSVDWDGK